MTLAKRAAKDMTELDKRLADLSPKKRALLAFRINERLGIPVAPEGLPSDKRLVAYVVLDRKHPLTITAEQLYRLPNHLEIVHFNKNETDVLYREIFEDQTYLKHRITIIDGDCIFDVGANIGLFTLFCPSNLSQYQRVRI